jgi:DNA-binding transcriptional LysR family regulator
MDIDLYALRIFSQVIADKSFSQAARSLRITQPTVSQQIAKLETTLNGKLFERVGHEIIPTPLAANLHRLATEMIEKVSDFESTLLNERTQPEGLVRYAMPESCQWTPHYKRIMSQISGLPLVRFEISILPNDQILQALLESKLDFGFVVGERLSPDLRFQKFSDEAYSAVAADSGLFSPLHASKTENLRIVTYPGWENFFTCWAKGHGLWNRMKNQLKESTVHVGTLAGAIHAVQSGAGMAVIPTHCVQADIDEKSLHEWKHDKGDKSERPSSPVYVARRLGEKQPKRVQVALDMLLQAKAHAG